MSAAHTAIGTSHLVEAESSKRDSAARSLPPQTLLEWLRMMVLIREFEVRTMQAYQDRKIGGFCHVYIGQEAVAVGCTAAVEHEDPIVTAYRDHGHALARGMDPKYCMAEMFGRIGGCAKGKGGSMHMFDRDNNLFGGHGIVGAQTPLGAGLAFGTKYIDEVINGGRSQRVTLCFLGDGALNQGALHEAMNLAGLLNLPVIFVVENNGYSMGTSIHRGTTMADEITSKAIGYGMMSAQIDGMDVMNVYDGMKEVVDEARATSRPAFVDIRTYRFKGHSMSDPRKYRTREEEEVYEDDGPIAKAREYLYDQKLLDEDGFKAMSKEVRGQVRESIKWADASPPPDVAEELYKDVYVERWGPYNGTSEPEMLGEPGGTGEG
ncbi:MAG: pyruvate dehydrogenase (acetyl-transferring) E1 component subunit alpha [Planctomycetota bacterium]|nr:pyruvate dehydrogenase (acetyl-transferring) E1 component subunit alpha [Planctomycetota bacterium]